MTEIRKVAVIGAGVMGASIAAHVANAGVAAVLLDIVPKDAANRNAIAEGAIEKMLESHWLELYGAGVRGQRPARETAGVLLESRFVEFFLAIAFIA